MASLKRLLASACLWAISSVAWAEGPAGLLAAWNFDEGQGDVAHDSSGNGHDAKVFGAKWVKQGDGFALSLDGVDDYVDCTQGEPLGVTGPVTVEAWVKPTREGKGEAMLIGESMHSYLLTYYNDELCYWYIGAGANSVAGKLKLGEWNHVAATFDGKRMVLWINGREAASRKSALKSSDGGGQFTIGTGGRPDLPKFKGSLDRVRVYQRAVSRKEVLAHIQEEAAEYGRKTMRYAPLEASTRFFETHPNAIDLEEQEDSLLFANRQVGLELRRSEGGFEISRLYGIAERQDFLTPGVAADLRDVFEIIMTLDPRRIGRDERGKTKTGLRGIMAEMAGDAFPVGSHAAKSASWRREGTDSESVLHLEWKEIDVREDKGVVDAEVTITLRAGDPLSYWRIAIRNRGRKYGIERVRFPLLTLAPIGKAEDDVLLLPIWRGCLVENPFSEPAGFGENYHTTGAIYPTSFNMQFQALYDGKSGSGIYLGTRDSAPSLMNIQIANTPSEIAWRPGHFPPNITFAEEDFSLTYDCVAGPFRGDWFDACRIYREWALKQSWCRKGPLTTRRDIPKWYKESPLYFYTELSDSATGTHSPLDNMRIAADHFREFLKWAGMRLPANRYSWKEHHRDLTSYDAPFNPYRTHSQGRWAGMPVGNIHDGNYPKLPALRTFSSTCKRLREDGGMVCPYVALQLFDQGPTENSPYAAEAKPHIIRDLYGAMYTWPSEYVWVPCTWSPWWRDRLTETCVLLLERENVGGFYLDVMHGRSKPCYWTPHGHTAAGGDSMTKGMHGLVEAIRDAVKAKDPDVITSGENSCENMIDVIDGILYQRTMRPENTAPLFGVVYQDYIPRYGLELSVDPGDAFFMECASLFVEGAQVGRLRLRPRSGTLSFQKPEHKEMLAFLGRLVGYYRQEATKKFLAYGQLMRPLEFRAPSPMPMLSYKLAGGYTYRGSMVELPALMSGVFRSDDDALGVFVVNASAKSLEFQAEMDPVRYGMQEGEAVAVDAFTPEGGSERVVNEAKGIVPLSGTLPAHSATMFRLKPTVRR